MIQRHPRRPPTLACIATALLGLSACATASADVGYVVPVGDEGDPKWLVEARAATGGIFKVGLAARTRLGPQHSQLALAPELSVEMSPRPLTVGARVGVHLVQFDREADTWTVGAGTPYLQPLLQLRVGDPVFLFLGGTLEYEISSNDGPDLLYVGAQLGLGVDL